MPDIPPNWISNTRQSNWGPLGVGEECLGGEIGDGLDPLGPKQSTQGTARAFVVIDDPDVRLESGAHQDVTRTLLPRGA